MSRLRRPPALRPGDRVALYAPSFPTSAWFPERWRRAVEGVRSLGLEIVPSPQATEATGFTAGDERRRAEVLRAFLVDPSVRAILTTIGGFNSAEILERLDAAEVAAHPKIVLGYSDSTALLLGLQAMGGWHTFYGPAVMTQFGEHPAPLPFTVDHFRRVLMTPAPPGELPDPEAWTDEFLDWGSDAWLARARHLVHPAARVVWRDGAGEGRLWGGNLETLNFLIGTPWLALPDDVILFWEATEEEAYLPRVKRALAQLRQVGILARTRAMMIGRSPQAKPVRGVDLRSVVLAAVEDFTFPVIADLAFGHTDPMLTLPLGARARVEAGTITLPDAAVE